MGSKKQVDILFGRVDFPKQAHETMMHIPIPAIMRRVMVNFGVNADNGLSALPPPAAGSLGKIAVSIK